MTIRHHHNRARKTAHKERCHTCKPTCKPSKHSCKPSCKPAKNDCCDGGKLVIGFTPDGLGYPICGNRACNVTVVNFNGAPYIGEIEQTFCSPNIFIGPIPPPDPIR